MSSLPQAMGNAVISCIHAAHTKYEYNPLDCQWVIEIGWCLLTRQDMERFQEMCKDGYLGGANKESSRIGRPLIGQEMGTSSLRMGWFRRERFRR
jgi:hypothetical protein